MSHLEQVAHQALRLADPLAHEVGRGDGEEGGVHLSRHSLCQVGFARAWRPIEQDPLPRLAVACEER
eukprot:CAMPEP_0185556098 /NCGR_PEP_ID=MMETSP1381-20130426/46208_1 /TAXON_ID=298111 /ORGANISM="Pavlova sp., Strain CCMP459" /LENGTH=66 /DNA_ID=CAMNT_0028169457 /DNA_START=83 /DNA_END=279 /DNA_ORIENTATION=-